MIGNPHMRKGIPGARTLTEMVPSPSWNYSHVKEGAMTEDIIQSILRVYRKYKGDTRRIARRFKGQTISEVIQKVHAWIVQEIDYVLDPTEGDIHYQFVKRPSVSLKHGFGDCKSYSILAGSILHNLGIPFKFRFTGYEKGGDFTHVYLVVGSQNLALDPCIQQPFLQRRFEEKIDFDMETRLVEITGIGKAFSKYSIGEAPKNIEELIDSYGIENIPEGLFDLVALKEGLELENKISQGMPRVSGPGQRAEANNLIDAIDDAILSFGNPKEVELIGDDFEKGAYAANYQSKKGDLGKGIRKKLAAKRKQSRVSRIQNGGIQVSNIGGGKVKNFFKKIANKTKDFIKKTNPVILASKAILQVLLPKASPFFLYLFIKPGQEIPSEVARKRAVAQRVKKFIVDGLGMKDTTFQQLVRNGIMKQSGATPETILNRFRSGQISGIGAFPVAVAVNFAVQIISRIANAIKKKKGNLDKLSVADAPNPNDFIDKVNNVVTKTKNTFNKVKDTFSRGRDSSPSNPSDASPGDFRASSEIMPTTPAKPVKPSPDRSGGGNNGLLIGLGLAVVGYLALNKG